MMRRIQQTNRNPQQRGGFTLIEMLVVLAILVLLMSMVGPRILGSREKADISSTKTQIGMFRGSLEQYNLDTRSYPSTEEGLVALVEAPADEEEGTSNWDGPYISKSEIPKDPWGNDYQYEFPPEHGKGDFPDIWSYGPDGEDNTDDDITNWTKEEGEEGEETSTEE
jgi:general secretion pathway protein G